MRYRFRVTPEENDELTTKCVEESRESGERLVFRRWLRGKIAATKPEDVPLFAPIDEPEPERFRVSVELDEDEQTHLAALLAAGGADCDFSRLVRWICLGRMD